MWIKSGGIRWFSTGFKAIKVKLDENLKQKLDDITAEYRRGDAVR